MRRQQFFARSNFFGGLPIILHMAELRITRPNPTGTAARPVRKTYRAPIVQRGAEDVFVQRALVPGTPVPLAPKFPNQSLDPILDIPCVDAVWRRCEKLVEGGTNFSWPLLGVHVYAAASLGVTNLTQVAQAVHNPQILGVVLESILYLVPRAALDANALARAVQSRWVQCVQLADIHNAADATAPAPDTGLHLPAWTGDDWGDWPLAAVKNSSRDFWLAPHAAVPFTLVPELAELAPWITTHGALVHASDGWKLLRWLRMVSAGFHNGRVPRGQYEAWIDHLVGHLAEILARKNIVEDFVREADTHPRRVLCVEPQVQTPDGRYASDIVVGDLDPATRTLQLVRAHEVTSSTTRADATAAQTHATLERRYPALGVRVLGDAQAQHFARLHIALDAANINTEPIVIDDTTLRPLATRVLETVRAWSAITHAVLGDLPREVAVGVRHNTGDLRIVGRIATAAMRRLVADFAEQCQQAGRVELEWLHWRVAAARAQSHSPLVRTQLQRMATVAANLVAREGHVRQSANSLARALQTGLATILTWEKILTPFLNTCGVLIAVRTGRSAHTVSGKKRAQQVAALCEAWAKSSDPVTTLIEQIRAVDPDRTAVLENLITRKGQVRTPAESLATTLGSTEMSIRHWEEAFTPILSTRGIPLAERIGKSTAIMNGKKLAPQVVVLCVAWANGSAPVTTLIEEIRTVDPNRAAVLENLIARKGQVRQTAYSLAPTLGISAPLLRRWEATFTPILNMRGIPVAGRTGRSAATDARRRATSEEK